jgi:hypothetical protein
MFPFYENTVIRFRIMKRTQTIGSGIIEVINMDDDKDLRAWADKFDVTKAKLKAAVNAVGNSPKNVESYLKKHSRKQP